ncbi:solute carrier family 23 protein [Actinosynnema sp. NPDC047251]|uniref:Putative pyrimidine permease n=1 Tax=Saccharothrix espanaensis (strain ATCC 51144 / DSM 44229 / JCM 9112 / NBRC 15066 / NRRL 15764) TaxID=1179773 RepID=K0K1T1_SACES|nr:solute carrier family 23 protein [Saccharothrix espanaensis]CCH34175.1 putative pyrimidine permease [Saccharothrix espanaensis DSM 44229]
MALWTVHGDGRTTDGDAVSPQERLSWPLTIGFGAQHLVAMAGATILVPAATGLPVGTTLLFSGVGTLLFLIITRNRVPSYLGASFAFIAPLQAARSEGIAAQLGGIVAAGLLVIIIGVAVKALGVRLLESVMPPVVTGAVVILIGLNLSHRAASSFAEQPLPAVVAMGIILLCGVLGRRLFFRFSVLLGVVVGWVLGFVLGIVDTAPVANAAWFGFPTLHAPELRPSVTLLILPVVIVLVAENVGHVKAVAGLTGRNLDGSVGDSIIANGLSTTLAGFGGAPGTTTYSENIGAMGVTKVYSTAAYAVTGVMAILLAFSPKATAALGTIPPGVVGGATLVLLGLITLVGVRIWMDNRVDLANPGNALVGGAALVAGVGDLTLKLGNMELGGLVWGSLLVVILHPIMRWLRAARRI